MTSDSAKCAKCFNYACGFESVFFAPDGVEISRLRPIVRLKHFAHLAHFARVVPDPLPAPCPPPPSLPVADDEPPPGYPAWDRPPMEAQDAWEVTRPMEGGGVAPFVAPAMVPTQVVRPPQNTLQTPRARAVYENFSQLIEDTTKNSVLPLGGIDAPETADRTALADPGSGSAPAKLASYGASPTSACDVPWLHPEVPAYAVADGGTMLVHRAPTVELRR